MGLDVASIQSFGIGAARSAGPPPRAAGAPPEPELDRVALSSDIPPTPPPEVLEAMDAAARVARELHERGRELRFVTGDDGRLRIELRDLDGNVLRRIPPTELLDIATGAPID